MIPPQPVLVVDLFPELLVALRDLLSGLSDAEWRQPTVCAGWSVKDVALHLLGGEIGNLSRRRDGLTTAEAPIYSWQELVATINDWNESWIHASRRISPPVLIDLLELTGRQLYNYFHTLDPYALGSPVSWAGPQPAPLWLDVAREYTERWHHQQHIRDAVSRPGMKQPRYLAPVIATFAWALPQAYHTFQAAEQTCLTMTITGEAGGRWSIVREARIGCSTRVPQISLLQKFCLPPTWPGGCSRAAFLRTRRNGRSPSWATQAWDGRSSTWFRSSLERVPITGAGWLLSGNV
jgi:uncharacterized protein (TIGR03083 family)